MRDHNTKAPWGFEFIIYTNAADTNAAVAYMHGTTLQGPSRAKCFGCVCQLYPAKHAHYLQLADRHADTMSSGMHHMVTGQYDMCPMGHIPGCCKVMHLSSKVVQLPPVVVPDTREEDASCRSAWKFTALEVWLISSMQACNMWSSC